MLLTKIKAGSVLIAEPSIIGDVSFQRSVVMVANHDEKGSVGFIMNKPLTHTLSDIVPSITSEFRIFNGGPVEQDNLYFIHNVPHLVPNSIEISEGIYWGGDFDVVVELIENKQISSTNVKFFLGYSGWSQNQLQDEMSASSWVVKDVTSLNGIISQPAIDYWRNEIVALGGEYLLWANAPENPTHN